ncbi:MAG: hypothetical protein KZQ90_07385 [Candidatus Thiodiazotropha sp. (ex Codakia rugifera)]|nr:hypothetical protein [Candidatus Thiodiazotropha sp. (ex Codakia rugifera)]
MKSIKYIAVTTLLLVSFSACADLEKGRAFQAFFSAIAKVADQQQAQSGGYQQGFYEGEYYDNGYQEVGYNKQGPVIFNLSGSWGMRGGKKNRFQKTYTGYHVIPVGRGKGVHYNEVGENLYQDANSSGTYEVIDRDYMIWRSNDRRNLEIELFRQ